MKFILGKKIEMTQKFTADGIVVPVTAVSVGPCYITQVKDVAKDGYRSLQFGYLSAKKMNKPLAGHLKNKFAAQFLRELRLEPADKQEYKVGQVVTAAVFAKGETVKVSGTSKGKGFQGVVKRHGFHGHNETHGTKDQVRRSGSIGAGGPQHVFKGVRMAGRMGGERVSFANLEIIDIDLDKNLLYIKGAVPGARNSLVEIYAPGEMKLQESIKAEPVKEAAVSEPVAPEVVAEAVEVKPEETKEEINNDKQ